jgi:hypothetical protein
MIPSMRRGIATACLALAALVGVSATPAGRASIVRSLATSPAGFTVQPDVTDRGCNGGKGVAWGAHLGQIPIVVSTALPDGPTVVAVSSGGFPTRDSVTLYSVTAACTANLAFGDGGLATIGPAAVPPKDHTPGSLLGGLQISSAAPARDGGVLLAGTYGGHWIVGEITDQGKPDASFGSGGWSILQYAGEVESIAQEPSGEIVLGTSIGSGCCVRNWMSALTATGQLETGFGHSGRTALPTGEDSAVGPPVLEANGNILATVAYGNMGYWGMAFEMLAPSGQPLPGFSQKYIRQTLDFGAFIGTAIATGNDFTVVGTGQKPGFRVKPAPSATGVIATFTATGARVRPARRFSSQSFGATNAFPDGAATLVVQSPYFGQTQLTIDALLPDGSLDASFASRGVARVRTPWRGQKAELAQVTVSESDPSTLVLVADDQGDQIQLTRLEVSVSATGSG